jgi:ribosomal protein S18 acetylase RimI-like enzyme
VVVVLREGVAADAPAVAEVHIAARRAMTYLPDLHTDAETRDWVAAVLLARCTLRVADGPGGVVGYAAFRSPHLEHLYVHPRSQDLGIGSRLLEWAKGASPAGVDLWVFERNVRATAFYEAHGFTVVRRTDGSGNEEREQDLLMAWSPGQAGPGTRTQRVPR